MNDLWDVQRVLNQVSEFSHHGTRVIINFHNHLWRIPLSIIKSLGLGAETLEQNWFSPNDVENLLNLSGLEVITRKHFIMAPIRMGIFGKLANRVLVHFIPFKWFALTTFMVARPRPDRSGAGSFQKPSVTVVIPARNEAGNIEDIMRRVPDMGKETELVFVEGHSDGRHADRHRKSDPEIQLPKMPAAASNGKRQRRCRPVGLRSRNRRRADDSGCRHDRTPGGSAPFLRCASGRQGRIHQRSALDLPHAGSLHAVHQHGRQQVFQPGLFLACSTSR